MEGLQHRSIPHRQRLFPNMDSGNVRPAIVLMALYDVPRKVDDRMLAAYRLEYVCAMNDRHAAWHCQAVEFLDDKSVMLEELRSLLSWIGPLRQNCTDTAYPRTAENTETFPATRPAALA